MTTVFIVATAISVFVIILVVHWALKGKDSKYSNRKKECSDWEIGDFIIVNPAVMKTEGISFSNDFELAELHGWSLEHLYLSFGCDSVYKVDWAILKHNKSASWRRNFNDCKKVMGKNPKFAIKFNPQPNKKSSGKIDGKSIDTFTETECQVYLKKAIEEENYELAELIKKQMEKFR